MNDEFETDKAQTEKTGPKRFADAVVHLVQDLGCAFAPHIEAEFRKGLLVLLRMEKLRIPPMYKIHETNGHHP